MPHGARNLRPGADRSGYSRIRATMPTLADVAQLIRARMNARAPFIVGITGAVAVGKSTMAAALKEVIAGWPEQPTVEVICTDGFLLANATLAARGLTNKKG